MPHHIDTEDAMKSVGFSTMAISSIDVSLSPVVEHITSKVSVVPVVDHIDYLVLAF